MVGCDVCGALHNLLRCAECQNCYCQSHQLSHWQTHNEIELRPAGQRAAPISSNWDQDEAPHSTINPLDGVRPSAASAPDFLHPRASAVPGLSPQSQLEQQFLGSAPPNHHNSLEADQGPFVHGWPTAGDLSSSISGYADAWDATRERVLDGGQFVSQVESHPPQPYLHRSSISFVAQPPEMPATSSDALWMRTMCHYVIRDMDKYGICVIDNFAGQTMGNAVLEEVVAMYGEGQFMDGEVMSTPGGNATKTIRGDKIVWVDGNEPICKNIGNLIHLVDTIVISSNRMRGNGKLGEYNISDRSRAMVACYPGGGTQYVKHVDNPNKDGRCITCIYYLNKDWDVKRDGGMLRIFPQGWTMSVADIDPTFDRILLFWSDRRNPHEVQPALRTRYAITLWYYDKTEAETAQRHLEQEAQQVHASNGANTASPF